MKRLKIVVAALLVVFLAGCFEIDEQIDITASGSGTLSVKTDMSQLIELMQNYVGKDELQKQMPQSVMDTTIMLRNLVDSSDKVDAAGKELVKNGSVHLQLNMDQKIFKTDSHFPFDNLGNLQKLYNSMNNQSLGFSELFKGAGKKDSSSTGPDMPDFNQFNAIYDFQCRDGLLSRKLNMEKWKTLQQNQQFQQMKDAGNMGIQVPYTLTINLPRPVKKVDNALAVLSADKKKLTLKYNFVEIFEHPEKFEYTIVY